MMTNSEKYKDVFIRIFELDNTDEVESLAYQVLESWDSLGHMALIAELERVFEVSIEMDDVIDLSSYLVGIEILKKYKIDL